MKKIDIVRYVDAASTLAESVTRDLKSARISNETVLHLSKFYKASKAVQELLDIVEQDRNQIN